MLTVKVGDLAEMLSYTHISSAPKQTTIMLPTMKSVDDYNDDEKIKAGDVR
jgi:hypothetical protein